jgi:hypothetical protein
MSRGGGKKYGEVLFGAENDSGAFATSKLIVKLAL